MVKVIWTELALEDLKQVHEYIARDSKKYAKRQIAKIINKSEQLQNQPLSGRIVPEFSDKSIRELFEGNYRIVYSISEEVVFIARIHHSSRLLTEI
ncbi:type II toxin-antitoxin system RelE/ParE family toxin [Algoriphagus sp. D3-2-R+10]|uniref:type II toxin-antitoxin system RelE/ParE family toxin n=1 Tax=Algoriphagus aurantiacus TaxID=3103948 RepID=UPI002B379392|nr:type II toxin-antitoxin system RelE/ParE family toxin [Algoriphagus sp. D3-2-R+10]MEB2774847.1 type II toxin-antitoxin system RelE/ParE family toxin [Algoriphagus sp. D3-2-R+10]